MNRIKAWWKRHNLARPDQIARRLIAFPFLHILRVLIVAVIFFGWGGYDAKRAWSDLS